METIVTTGEYHIIEPLVRYLSEEGYVGIYKIRPDAVTYKVAKGEDVITGTLSFLILSKYNAENYREVGKIL